jgi:hypothetical protein
MLRNVHVYPGIAFGAAQALVLGRLSSLCMRPQHSQFPGMNTLKVGQFGFQALAQITGHGMSCITSAKWSA